MVQKIYKVAKTTSLFVGIATSLFLVSLALPRRWITFQLIVFIILKLCSFKKTHDAGAADAAYDVLPEAWYDDLYPSSHAAAASCCASPYEPMPPEVVKEVLLEDEEEEYEDEEERKMYVDEEKDVRQVMMASMDEIWKAITEGRGAAKKTNGTWERYRQRAEADAASATSGARREMVRISQSTMSYKKKDQVDVKALPQKKKKKRQEDDEDDLAVWRKPREVLAVGHDELFRRVEAFIRMQHDHLRLQQRESEHRRFLERLQQQSS